MYQKFTLAPYGNLVSGLWQILKFMPSYIGLGDLYWDPQMGKPSTEKSLWGFQSISQIKQEISKKNPLFGSFQKN